MKRIQGLTRWQLVGVFALLGLALAAVSPTESGARGGAKPARYVGAGKCKTCHSKENTGNQYEVWTETKHAQTVPTLSSDQAKEYGVARGVEDPSTSADCLKCHVTGYGLAKELFTKSFKPELGVQCESCHGPGEKHVKARLMAADDEEDDPFGGDGAGLVEVSPGEIIAVPTADTCLVCHNEESPGFKPFCFHERMQLIRHLNPKKPRTKEELEALSACSCEETCICRKDSPDKTCRGTSEAGG